MIPVATECAHDLRLPLTLNGRAHRAEIDPRSLLIDAVRMLGGKGAKVGCGTGDCGACTLLLDGRLVKSCLILAVAASGCEVRTIEGCDDPITRSLQDAFIARKGFQCGFCTAGMILTARDLLERNADPSEAEIRHGLLGNLCRCTGYDDIVAAVAEAAGRLREVDGSLGRETNKKSRETRDDE